MKPEIARFADYVALAYHEARNVRHLVKDGHLERSRYRLLIDALDKDKQEAWKKLERLRCEAASTGSAHDAEGVFRRRFGLSLEDLVALSENLHWSGTQRGGNRWAEIDRALIELRNAIDEGDEKRTSELLGTLPLMCHNTGRLGEKLELLRVGCPERD